MRQLIFILFLIWFSLFITITAPVHAAKVRTIEGIIQNVTDNSIQVRGKDYNISGIPLIDPSGKHLKKASLTTGKKVEIFFQEDRISSILINDDMVE
jgi:hypothetical protein